MDKVLVTFSLHKYFLLGKCKAECMTTCPAGLEQSLLWSSSFKTEVAVNSVLTSLSF